MNSFARKHYQGKEEILRKKILDKEFLKYQLQSVREGFRMEYDRMREHLDASIRRMMGEKYQFFHCESGEELDYKVIPILPEDLEKLPDEPKDTKDFRFYKKLRTEYNQTVVDNMQEAIKRFTDDITQLKAQLDGIDGQFVTIDQEIEGMHTAMKLLREYIKMRD